MEYKFVDCSDRFVERGLNHYKTGQLFKKSETSFYWKGKTMSRHGNILVDDILISFTLDPDTNDLLTIKAKAEGRTLRFNEAVDYLPEKHEVLNSIERLIKD